MELKALIYVVAIIAWLVFKFLEKQKDILKKIAQKIEPPVVAQNAPPVKPVLKKSLKLPIVKKVVKPEIKTKSGSTVEKLHTETVPKINVKEDIPEPLETRSFIDEIRGGNVDWRKAILLSEILRPV